MNCSRVVAKRPFKIGREQRRQRADQAGGHHRLYGGIGDARQLALQQVDEAGHPFGARLRQHGLPLGCDQQHPATDRVVDHQRDEPFDRVARACPTRPGLPSPCCTRGRTPRGRTRRGRRSSRRSSARSGLLAGRRRGRSARDRPHRPTNRRLRRSVRRAAASDGPAAVRRTTGPVVDPKAHRS